MRARITWEKHGDIRVMKANGWIRALVYYEGGWWGIGVLDRPAAGSMPGSPSGLYFRRSLADIKRLMVQKLRRWQEFGDGDLSETQFGQRKAAK